MYFSVNVYCFRYHGGSRRYKKGGRRKTEEGIDEEEKIKVMVYLLLWNLNLLVLSIQTSFLQVSFIQQTVTCGDSNVLMSVCIIFNVNNQIFV